MQLKTSLIDGNAARVLRYKEGMGIQDLLMSRDKESRAVIDSFIVDTAIRDHFNYVLAPLIKEQAAMKKTVTGLLKSQQNDHHVM